MGLSNYLKLSLSITLDSIVIVGINLGFDRIPNHFDHLNVSTISQILKSRLLGIDGAITEGHFRAAPPAKKQINTFFLLSSYVFF